MRALTTTAALAAAILSLAAGGTALGQDVIVPAEWAGIWQVDTNIYTCSPRSLIGTSSGPDTLCAGAVMDYPTGEVGFTIDCNATIDGDTVTMECTGSGVIEGCPVTYEMTSTTTRTGETFTSVTTVTITFGGECAIFPPQCTRIETTATRTAGPPATCVGTAVESIAWGALKGIYR